MANPRTKFIVENFEKPSEWLSLEYRNCARIAAGRGNFLVSGVGSRKGLPKIPLERRHSWELGLIDPIVLDPKATETLEPEDFSEDSDNFVVIGGICGDVPPKARTFDLLTRRFAECRPRNLGYIQFSIDTSLWVAKRISEGKTLSELPFAQRAEIPVGKYETVKLSFGYPFMDGKARITPGLAKLLKTREKF